MSFSTLEFDLEEAAGSSTCLNDYLTMTGINGRRLTQCGSTGFNATSSGMNSYVYFRSSAAISGQGFRIMVQGTALLGFGAVRFNLMEFYFPLFVVVPAAQ